MNRTARIFALTIAAAATLISGADVNAQSGGIRQRIAIPGGGGQVRAIVSGSYYSPRLKARFVVEQMTIPGHCFLGARIVDMDFNSPLRQINLHVGDVVTRIDGIRVTNGKFRQNDFRTGQSYWALPQMEKHYSHAHVRFIRTGTHLVQQLTVDLGPLNNWGGGGIPGGGVCPIGGGIAP